MGEVKPIFYVVGDEDGNVHHHEPHTIYARECFLGGNYGDSFPIEIPEEYRGLEFHYGERILVSPGKRYFKGKDFRSHITEDRYQESLRRTTPLDQITHNGNALLKKWASRRFK
jgi:hypothetical protein